MSKTFTYRDRSTFKKFHKDETKNQYFRNVNKNVRKTKVFRKLKLYKIKIKSLLEDGNVTNI